MVLYAVSYIYTHLNPPLIPSERLIWLFSRDVVLPQRLEFPLILLVILLLEFRNRLIYIRIPMSGWDVVRRARVQRPVRDISPVRSCILCP